MDTDASSATPREPRRGSGAPHRDAWIVAGGVGLVLRVAIFLAVLVMSPLLFLGASIVYVDLVARVGLSRAERRRLRLGVTGQAK